jgi:hypothetical protein
VPDLTPVFRAPMRARDDDPAPGTGADFGLGHGLVGIGDRLDSVPATIEDAITMAMLRSGEKAGRMLRRFASLPSGTFVWTRDGGDRYHLGRIAGPWRYDDSPAAREAGIHHVRATSWHAQPFDEDHAPGAVVATFVRGGRNLQRIRDEGAEQETAQLWAAGSPSGSATSEIAAATRAP